MKRVFYLLAAALMAASCQESLEQRTEREAKMYTAKNCPQRIDDVTVMDSMTFDRDGHVLGYHYRLSGAADSIGALDFKAMRQSIIDRLSNSPAMKTYKEKGYSFRYVYHSDKHPETVLFECLIEQSDYDK